MSFSPADIRRLDDLRAHYPDARAASVSVMKWVQRRDGHISDAALRDCADYLGVPATELEGLSTFYNLLFRKPVGRNVVKVCDSVSCWMNGYEEVRDRLRATLGVDFGQTTADGEFTLLPVVCLGNCDQAPTLMINDALHDRVTPAAADELIAAAGGAVLGTRTQPDGGGQLAGDPGAAAPRAAAEQRSGSDPGNGGERG